MKNKMLTVRIQGSDIDRLDAVVAHKHPGKTRGAVIREILNRYVREQEAVLNVPIYGIPFLK